MPADASPSALASPPIGRVNLVGTCTDASKCRQGDPANAMGAELRDLVRQRLHQMRAWVVADGDCPFVPLGQCDDPIKLLLDGLKIINIVQKGLIDQTRHTAFSG